MTIYFRLLFLLLLCVASTGITARSIATNFVADSIGQDTTKAPEPGQTVSQVAIGAAGVSLGLTALYAMFDSVQGGGGGLVAIAVIGCLLGLVAGIVGIAKSKRKTRPRKRSVAAVFISLGLLIIGIVQAGKALDQG